MRFCVQSVSFVPLRVTEYAGCSREHFFGNPEPFATALSSANVPRPSDSSFIWQNPKSTLH